MYSLYGAIPGMPTFPGMMPGMPQPMGPPGMGPMNSPMANAAPQPIAPPAQRGGMGVPTAPPPAMQGQPQQDPMQQMAMMQAMRGGQQGVPGSQLSNILGISGSDVRSFLGMGGQKDKLTPDGALPEMMKSGGPFGMGSLTTGEMKTPYPMGVPPMDAGPGISSSLGQPPQMMAAGPPLDPGIGMAGQTPWWQNLGFSFGF